MVSRVWRIDDLSTGNWIVLSGEPKHDAAIKGVALARLLTPFVKLDTPHLAHECELIRIGSMRDDVGEYFWFEPYDRIIASGELLVGRWVPVWGLGCGKAQPAVAVQAQIAARLPMAVECAAAELQGRADIGEIIPRWRVEQSTLLARLLFHGRTTALE